MNTLKQLALAIQDFEVYKPGSLTFRNKNPGALRASPFSSGSANGYSVFPDYQTGFAALLYDLRNKCLGNTRTGLGPESTLLDFFRVYAPALDKNKPDSYAKNVAAKLGLQIIAKLKEIYILPAIPEQKILVILANKPSARVALAFLAEWFEVLGIKTTLTIVDDYYNLDFVVLPDSGKKVVDPRLVELIASKHIQDHHFVLFCYKSDTGLTAIEYPKTFLGAVATQVPVLDVSTPWYTVEYMAHELLHGWYFRAGKVAEDDVHQKSFSDARTEYNYESIVEKLRPSLETIFRPQTFEEKKVGYLTAIRDFLLWAIEVLKKKVGASNK